MSEPMTAVLLRAAELTASGKPRQAIDLLRPLVAANPRHSEAWCRLAAAHLDVGEADQALDAAKRAMVLDSDAWPQRLAALALSDLGRHSEAAVSARESVRRKPGDWRGYVVLAEVLADSPEGAVEAFDSALHASQLAPSEARAFQVLGDAALRMRDWGTAEHAYRAAIKLDPSDADSKANLATVQRRRSSRPVQVQLNKVQVWRALRTLSLLLIGGGLLALIAGMPRPTPYLGFFTGALVLCCLVVGLRLRPYKLLFSLRKLAVTVSLLGVSALILVGWTVALFFGATTMQPLVLSWLCAVVGGALVYVGGGRKR
ncbi:tetratricopeptide repeat protein [Lentzea sp. JNUCC 0626]|uniref:tetratricopeptide repeat protein n=1 Tax=Lentzea sp. JNUCC 0626 TaxID=3367513 RepID=UPI003749E6B8